MKWIVVSSIVVTHVEVGLLAFAAGGADGLKKGFTVASQSFTKCSDHDNSKDVFPEYFQACKVLCNSLYKDKPICVSSINGGSVTCVCEQTESQ